MSEVRNPVVLPERCSDVALYVWTHVSCESVICFLKQTKLGLSKCAQTHLGKIELILAKENID